MASGPAGECRLGPRGIGRDRPDRRALTSITSTVVTSGSNQSSAGSARTSHSAVDEPPNVPEALRVTHEAPASDTTDEPLRLTSAQAQGLEPPLRESHKGEERG